MNDILITVIITIGITLLTYIIIYSLKPNLRIKQAKIDGDKIRVEVVNEGNYSAVNVRIEICAFDKENRFSWHFDTDHKDFLIIPSKCKGRDNEKTFKTIGFIPKPDTSAENYESLIRKLSEKKLELRVRLHSYHSLSGLGSAREKIFTL